MTATAPAPEALTTETPTSDWNARLSELQRRYPKVREPILAALQVLAQDPD